MPVKPSVVAVGIALASASMDARGQPTSPAPTTDIYLAPIRLMPSAPAMGPARVASENPGGYDNQPFFGPDARAMLFTSNRDGKQTDIYFVELQTRQIRQLTTTPESEYSPTVMPDERGVSAIRVEADGTQRLWRFDELGGAPTVVLRDVKPVGYHAWVDPSRVAVFVLGQPPTLQLVEVPSGKTTIVARDIGRSLHRHPASGTITFTHRVDGRWLVREWVPASGELRDLVPALEGSGDRDMAWAPDGTLFMTKGGEVHWWRPGQSEWTLLADPEIGTVTRLAVSPDGRWLALVAVERPR